MFSIIIVSWNNLNHLRIIIDSIKNNSYYKYHQIIVYVNEGIDGTIEYLKENSIRFIHSDTNVGFIKGANEVAKLSVKDIICICDDDLYLLPEWDKRLIDKRGQLKVDHYWISSTMIEPEKGGFGTISPKSYGSFSNFEEERILNDCSSLRGSIPCFINIQATPVIFPIEDWKAVGGYPEEFGIGIGNEEGLSKRFYDIGCRTFITVNDSLVYHFQRQSTRKIEDYSMQAKNREDQFLKLFGITTKEFGKIIGRGGIHASKEIS